MSEASEQHECSGCAELREIVAQLGEVLATHLRESELYADYITTGPEPSDDVAELVRKLREERG